MCFAQGLLNYVIGYQVSKDKHLYVFVWTEKMNDKILKSFIKIYKNHSITICTLNRFLGLNAHTHFILGKIKALIFIFSSI